MAGTLSEIDKLLDLSMVGIQKCLILPDSRDELKLLGKANKRKVFGRGLETYYQLKLSAAGSYGRGSENGAFPAGVSSGSVETKFKVFKLWSTVEFSDEQIKAMDGGREKLRDSVADELKDMMKAWRSRKAATFMGGRGDGVVFRVDGAVTAAAKATSSIPILAVEGDRLQSWDNRGTKDASRTGNNITADAIVDFVDHENREVYFTAVQTVDDNKVVGYSSGALDQETTKFQWPCGLPQHLDDVNVDTSNWWDVDDAAAYDHVDTYGNQARSSYRKLNCRYYKFSPTRPVDLIALAMGASMAEGLGHSMNEVLYVMNHKLYRRILKAYSGGLTTNERQEIKLPGGKARLPVITGVGQGQMPVLLTWYIPDGMYACVGMDDFEQVVAGGEWETLGGSKALPVMSTSTGTIKHERMYAFYAYWNTVCKRPYRQVVVDGISTDD